MVNKKDGPIISKEMKEIIKILIISIIGFIILYVLDVRYGIVIYPNP